MGLVMGRTLTSLSRQASTSSGSQEQLPPASADQQPPYQQQPLQHQSSSPQIRTYGPDGRHHEALHAASSYPPSRGSRSPSPVRAASLDARSSPRPLVLTSGQSSGGSLCSLAGSSQLQAITHHQQSCGGPSPAHHHSPKQPSSSSSSSSSGVAHQHQPASPGRCLSPLLIPPPRASFSLGDSGSGPPASPLGALQPDLYRSRAEPIILPSSSRRSGKSLGRLHLRLSYDYDKSDLDVYLIKGENIPSSDHGGFNDPYIKLTLSPEVDARKRQTPVWSHEPNPHFDQHFKFPVSHDELQDKTLIVQVLDFDRTSRNDMFGSVRVILDELNLTSSTSPVEIVGDISRERKPPEETQEVLISLSYLPSAQRLTLVVHRARNLFPGPGRDTLDPFVKVGLLSNDRRVKKKKTAVCKATRSPAWDEAMSFNVPTSALGSSAIEICVVDSSSEAAGNDAIIGTCIIGPGIATTSNYDNAPNPSREHWLVMANSPRQTISKWHVLH
ncbi:synaptotagmin-5 [Copidosoma floridanum]|uniref:synaptotagmin-5 n=1 Tax=Copidosoma floridanum TaxID=29053 RepID=UPI000C6F5B4F|nr:synaptotagmin-5 [Copidosoma floridanum]